MNWIRQRVDARRWARINAINSRLEAIKGVLDHTDPASPKAEALQEERVRLFWKRNALYLKLNPTQE